MAIEMKDLAKLAKDAYHNRNLEFNNVSASDAMRNAVKDALGGEFTSVSWGKNKWEVFSILQTALDVVIPERLKNQLDGFADYRTANLGDKPLFTVKDPRAVRVGRIAGGANDMRRQTITGRSFTIETEWYGAAVYAEFEQFMAGDIDWTDLVNRVADGFVSFIEERIAEGLEQSYTLLATEDKINGSLTLDGLVKLAQRIKIKSGGKDVAVYGTASALAKIAALDNVQLYSGDMKNELNQKGYLGMVRGLKLIEIPQAFKTNSDEFAIGDDKVIVLPAGEKIVGVVTEGTTEVYEADQTSNTSMQLGFATRRKLGVGVLQMRVYGMAKLA
ncbi:hypothetical protein [Ligilactobacillus salivarius]|uniref:Phage major capsid protein n=1 Tax=Ligilactobacillus salivarius TaxID=1624 RepID=A0A089QIZ4_9LACO|nr:hypothetical protein [Ligilactobacillus salivarius]AIR11763.1 hypothetical protein LSJ_3147c [Ligilactobacillus salivarius]